MVEVVTTRLVRRHPGQLVVVLEVLGGVPVWQQVAVLPLPHLAQAEAEAGVLVLVTCRHRPPQLLAQAVVAALLCYLCRVEAEDVGQVEVTLVAETDQGPAQSGQAVLGSEVEEIVMVLVLASAAVVVVGVTAGVLRLQQVGDAQLLLQAGGQELINVLV